MQIFVTLRTNQAISIIMKRKVYKQLLEWKNSPRRKPLVVEGARQVGKSWILKEFGRNEYANLAYISCENEPLAPSLFADYDIERIVRGVEAITKVRVVPGDTLIVFDEIQEVTNGLSTLKYFCENHPEYHVAVAGSLLGITLHQGTSFPVGKTDFIKMHPMDFEEFLWAKGETILADFIADRDIRLVAAMQPRLTELLKEYFYVGGMPEVVDLYVADRDVMQVRKLQLNILEAYRNDISKHAPASQIERIQLVLRTLPGQLAKENKKFVYSAVRSGSRAADFEVAIQWLIDAGLVTKVSRINSPQLPLPFYEDFNAFKLFYFDCGLFGAMADTDAAQVLVNDTIYTEYKGAFAEAYVLQQLTANFSDRIYYYSADNSRVEIDFVTKHAGNILPIEVKAGVNVKAKSLRLFTDKNDVKLSVRFSMQPYIVQDRIVNIPLTCAFALAKWLE